MMRKDNPEMTASDVVEIVQLLDHNRLTARRCLSVKDRAVVTVSQSVTTRLAIF